MSQVDTNRKILISSVAIKQIVCENVLTTAKEIYRRKIGERKKKSERKKLTTVNAITWKLPRRRIYGVTQEKINLILIKSQKDLKSAKKMM